MLKNEQFLHLITEYPPYNEPVIKISFLNDLSEVMPVMSSINASGVIYVEPQSGLTTVELKVAPFMLQRENHVKLLLMYKDLGLDVWVHPKDNILTEPVLLPDYIRHSLSGYTFGSTIGQRRLLNDYHSKAMEIGAIVSTYEQNWRLKEYIEN